MDQPVALEGTKDSRPTAIVQWRTSPRLIRDQTPQRIVRESLAATLGQQADDRAPPGPVGAEQGCLTRDRDAQRNSA